MLAKALGNLSTPRASVLLLLSGPLLVPWKHSPYLCSQLGRAKTLGRHRKSFGGSVPILGPCLFPF